MPLPDNIHTDMKKDIIKKRLRSLRRWMAEEGYDAFVVPTVDPHDSEYTPEHWKAREWLTGFDGSAGTAVVTNAEAALWTDSRYFLQAEQQLEDTTFCLMREGLDGTPSPGEWLSARFAESGRVGYYGGMMTTELSEALFGGLPAGCVLVCSDTDPFDCIWTDRPGLPVTDIVLHPESLAGISAAEKLRTVWQQAVRDCGEDAVVMLNDLSEIAWVLNLRAADIDYNPLFVSYLVIGRKRATLFTDERRVTPETREYLMQLGVRTARYKGWRHELEDMSPRDTVVFPRGMNLRVIDCCRRLGLRHVIADSPVPALRAVKTEAEQVGFRRAMERDGVAMVRFLRWLQEAVPQGRETELSIDRRLTAFRAEQAGFCGLSFATIAGYGPHGAIVHYEASGETAARLEPRGLLLLDSGAHYVDGTTDLTRTVALGPVTNEERRVYTLVLKGHIALSRCRFPEGTTGIQLDLAARYAMWREGYDFGHGTGHGVGSRLCVHEGPHQIRKNLRSCTSVPFRSGMVVTDEPGIYVTGRFGVRIENVLLVRPAVETDFGRFLEFEPLTLCPIDLSPVDFSLLTADECRWLDDYHRVVRQRLLPRLDDPADRDWLVWATREVASWKACRPDMSAGLA